MNPAQGPKMDERRLLALAASRLSSEGYTQGKIAECLNTSQPEVSRLLVEAKAHWHYNRHPTLQRRYVDTAEWNEVERRYFIDQDLVKQLRDRRIPRGLLRFDARVFPGNEDEFAYRAAGRVAELLQRAHRIGVMWGRTLLKVIDEIAARWNLPKGAKPPSIDCIPLCGDPVFLMNQRDMVRSASHLAATLEIALTGSRNPDLPCLIGVPAYVPTPISKGGRTRRSDLWDFLDRIVGYQSIFKKAGGQAWADRVDTILTGLGVVSSSDETADFIEERMRQEKLDKQTVAELVHGDIGGLLLERENLNLEQRLQVERLQLGWTGIEERHLTRVSNKAKPDGPPGVIVVAAGKAKAEMVDLVISKGYVNELIIDCALARRLREL